MIILIGATSITLAALQASINAPRDAFRDCLKSQSAKAQQEKVGADDFEAYARKNCSVQLDSLRSALITFDMKNGMGHKAAASDADMTVDDYVASPVDKYRFMAGRMTVQTAPAATPAPTPAPPPPPKR